MIEISKGTKKFGSLTVFENLSIQLETGKYYTLTGPNGSGKSTLMNCLLRQEKLDSGEIKLEGISIEDVSYQYSKTVFGINDAIGWLPGVTVGQHLEILLQNNNYFQEGFKPKYNSAQEALAELDITKAYDKLPHMLSSGQEQRSRLASLLLRPAKYYFLDEPEKRLDTNGIQWIAQWVQEVTQTGSMVCIATHNSILNKIPGTNSLKFSIT